MKNIKFLDLKNKNDALKLENFYEEIKKNNSSKLFDFVASKNNALPYIAFVDDQSFGEQNTVQTTPAQLRFGVRAIIVDDNGKIAVFNKANKNEFKLPGGGIEEGENPQEAILRECFEEAGVNIEIEKCIGITEEFKTRTNFKQLSFVFLAKVKSDANGIHPTAKEREEGAQVFWLDKLDAYEKIHNCLKELKASKYDSVYTTKFMVLRDAEIVKYYINNF